MSYTDALIESNDADGEMLGEKGLLRIANLLGNANPQDFIDAVLSDIGGRHPGNLTDDDVTVLVVRANGKQPRYTLREKLDAQMRFLKTFVMSVRPKAERAPFPDANLANLGGAIIPALARRWRAKK
jgi:hypothetical protein